MKRSIPYLGIGFLVLAGACLALWLARPLRQNELLIPAEESDIEKQFANAPLTSAEMKKGRESLDSTTDGGGMSIFQASVGTVEVQLQFLGKVFSPVLIEVGWNGGSRAVTLFASHGEVNVPEWPPVWLNAEPRDCSLQRQRIHIQERAEATEDRVLSVVVVIGLAGTVVVSTVDSVSGLPIKGHYVEASTIGGPWQQMHGITSLGGVHTFCGLSVGDWEIVAPAWREYKQTDHTTLRVIAGESRDIKLMISPSASPCIKGRLEGLANSGATDGILNRYRLDRGDKIGSHVIYDDGAFYIFEIIDGHAKVRVIDEENARKSQWMMLSEGDNGKLAVIW